MSERTLVAATRLPPLGHNHPMWAVDCPCGYRIHREVSVGFPEMPIPFHCRCGKELWAVAGEKPPLTAEQIVARDIERLGPMAALWAGIPDITGNPLHLKLAMATTRGVERDLAAGREPSLGAFNIALAVWKQRGDLTPEILEECLLLAESIPELADDVKALRTTEPQPA